MDVEPVNLSGNAAAGSSAVSAIRSGPPTLPGGIILDVSDPPAAVDPLPSAGEPFVPLRAAERRGRSRHAPTAWSGPGASLLRRQATRAPERTPGRARTFSECPRKRTSGSSAAEKVDPGGLARIHFGKGSWYGPVESSRDHRGTEEKSRSGVSPHSCRKLLCGQHLSASTIYVSHAPAHAP